MNATMLNQIIGAVARRKEVLQMLALAVTVFSVAVVLAKYTSILFVVGGVAGVLFLMGVFLYGKYLGFKEGLQA